MGGNVWGGIAHDLGGRRVGLIEIGIGKFARDARQALNAGDLLDACLDPTAFIAFGHAIQNLLGFGGPFDLEAVEGDLFVDVPFAGGRGGDRSLVDSLEARPVANRAGVRLSAA